MLSFVKDRGGAGGAANERLPILFPSLDAVLY